MISKENFNILQKEIYKSVLIVIIIKILLYSITKTNIKKLISQIFIESFIVFLIIYLTYPISKKLYDKIKINYKNELRLKLSYDIISIIISTIIKLLLYKIFYNKKIVFNQLILSVFFVTFYFVFIEPLFGSNKFSEFMNKFVRDFIMFYNLDLFDDGVINKTNIELYFSIISSLLKITLDKIII